LAANELSKLNPSLDREFPDLNLSLAYKSRNKLSHGYFAVEQEIVWNTVTVSIRRPLPRPDKPNSSTMAVMVPAAGPLTVRHESRPAADRGSRT